MPSSSNSLKFEKKKNYWKFKKTKTQKIQRLMEFRSQKTQCGSLWECHARYCNPLTSYVNSWKVVNILSHLESDETSKTSREEVRNHVTRQSFVGERHLTGTGTLLAVLYGLSVKACNHPGLQGYGLCLAVIMFVPQVHLITVVLGVLWYWLSDWKKFT